MKPHEYRVTEEELNAVRREAMEFSGVGIYRYLFDGTILFIDRMALRILDLEDAYPDPTMLAGRNIETLIIYTGPRGLFPHDLARDALEADLKWRNPDGFRDMHRRAHQSSEGEHREIDRE